MPPSCIWGAGRTALKQVQMSIFDVTLGQRPAAVGALTPAEQKQPAATALSPSVHAGITTSLGERPRPCCPPVIVWPDALEGEAEKMLSGLPPAHPPALLVRPAEQALAEIDAALRRNSARVTVNGLFDLDDHHWDDR